LVGQYAYVTRGSTYKDNRSLVIIDLQNPSNLTIIGGASFGKSLSSSPILEQDGYLFVGNYDPVNRNDCVIAKLASPGQPTGVKRFTLGSRVEALAVKGRYPFIRAD